MSGLGRVIVGYREGDPVIPRLWSEHGRVALPHRGCMNCGALCYFVESGQDAIRSRDPEVVCTVCYRRPDVKRAILAEI